MQKKAERKDSTIDEEIKNLKRLCSLISSSTNSAPVVQNDTTEAATSPIPSTQTAISPTTATTSKPTVQTGFIFIEELSADIPPNSVVQTIMEIAADIFVKKSSYNFF